MIIYLITINRYIKYPFSCLTNRIIFPIDFERSYPICFIFFDQYYGMSEKYIKFLKGRFKNSSFVLYAQDKVRFIKGFNIEKAKHLFDLIYSYDHHDCEQYGLIYYPTPYSKYEVPSNTKLPETDVFFCGKAKTRYDVILKTYEVLKSKGLSCDFYLTSVPDECPRLEGIHYNKGLDYVTYLQHLTHSHCVLEVMQEGADGFTPRLWESIMYDKHLLTNNESVFSSHYNNMFIHELNSSLCSNFGFIRTPASYDIDIKKSLSPLLYLKDIESRLY